MLVQKEAEMTTDMFIGGLMILTVVIVIVVSMTSSNGNFFERLMPGRRSDRKNGRQKDD